MAIKALFFDIDGTLVSFKTHQIPESTVDALRKVHGSLMLYWQQDYLLQQHQQR